MQQQHQTEPKRVSGNRKLYQPGQHYRVKLTREEDTVILSVIPVSDEDAKRYRTFTAPEAVDGRIPYLSEQIAEMYGASYKPHRYPSERKASANRFLRQHWQAIAEHLSVEYDVESDEAAAAEDQEDHEALLAVEIEGLHYGDECDLLAHTLLTQRAMLVEREARRLEMRVEADSMMDTDTFVLTVQGSGAQMQELLMLLHGYGLGGLSVDVMNAEAHKMVAGLADIEVKYHAQPMAAIERSTKAYHGKWVREALARMHEAPESIAGDLVTILSAWGSDVVVVPLETAMNVKQWASSIPGWDDDCPPLLFREVRNT